MPRNGSGTYTRTDGTYTGPTTFQQEAANGVDIEAVNLDYEAQDAADALTASIANDGQTPILANLPMSGFKHTGVAAATSGTDYLRADQGQTQSPNWSGTFGGTANALTCTLSPAIAAYTAGTVIRGIIASNNTATSTLNANAVGTITIKKKLAGGKVALTGGELIAGETVEFVSDGADLILMGKGEWQASAALTSAATVDLATSTGEYVSITGSTGPITSFGTLPAGTTRTLVFASTPTITYNGTSMILLGGASRTMVAGNVMVVVSEGGGNWREVLGPSVGQGLHTIDLEGRSFTPRTTNGPAAYSSETTTNDVMVVGLGFDQTTSEGAQARFVMPQSWNAGTITARLRWTAASGTGTVTWGVQAVALRDNVAIDTAFGTAVTVTDTLLTVLYEHVTSTTSAITIGNSPAKADTIIVQVYRDISDTLNADAILLSVEIFSTINAATDA